MGIVEHLTPLWIESNMSHCPEQVEIKDGTSRDQSNFSR
jgi:hypothetical protein